MRFGLLPDSALNPALIAPGSRESSWPTLLVVDSDQKMAQTLVCFFERLGFHVASGASLAEARDFFHRRKTWTLVIADYYLPDGTGLELCCWMREQAGNAPFLLMSASPHCAALCDGIDFLAKPFKLEQIEAYVRTLALRSERS